MSTKHNYSSILKAKGLKVTKHRNSILEILNNTSKPITAENIYDKLKKENISISLSSIYKILDVLTVNNVISKCIIGTDSKTSYEMNTSDDKHHLICKNCSKVIPIKNCPICEFKKQLNDEIDFDVTEHKLEFYGFCSDCKKYK